MVGRANPIHPTVFATGIVDLHRGKPIDIIPGRSRKVLADWLISQPAEWTAGIEVAAAAGRHRGRRRAQSGRRRLGLRPRAARDLSLPRS
jgi:hypothetical protein